MSKPDFFLPFHLPMVIPDDDPRNIEYKGWATDDDFSDYRQRYIHQCIVKSMTQLVRIKEGCYQTMNCGSLYPSQTFYMQPVIFSISLN